MDNLRNKNEVTSLELLEEINKYREIEHNYKVENNLKLGKVELRNGKFTELRHDTLINIIRDEFEEEIQLQNILELQKTIKVNNGGKKSVPYFILTLEQAKQVLLRESKYVRKGVLEYIHKLENYIKENQIQYNRIQVQSMTNEELEFRKEELKLRKLELLKDVRDNVRIDSYKDILNSIIVKETTGEMYLPLPKIEQLSYSATEICKILLDRYDLKVSVQKLGRVANKENLKVEGNGIWILDKKKYSDGTTETFRYYEKMVDVFYNILKGESNEKY